jgi:uncharacterized membrane protein YqjE
MAERTLSEILDDIVKNVQEIVRFEIRLAKVELRREGYKLVNAAIWTVVGAVLGVMSAGVLLCALVAGLATQMAVWESALLVGVGLAIVATLVVVVGSRRFAALQPPLTQTVASLNETVKGTRAWISSND